MPEPSNGHDSVSAYLDVARTILDTIGSTQRDVLEAAAQQCARAITANRLVHVFGSGHSRIVVEELWPRYGSYPGFHPIVELSLTAYHQVVGANGQRQAMYLENVPGLAAQILRNFAVSSDDVLLAISSGGTSVVTVELAELARDAGLAVVAITGVKHSKASAPAAASGKRLCDVAQIVLDTCIPVGDAAIRLDGLDVPVAPTSTIAGALLANALKIRTAELLLENGVRPSVLPSAAIVGPERAAQAFDQAYAEHARRTSVLYRP